MTPEDLEVVPEHILSALRADGKASAPAGAQGRVLARLGVAAAAGVAAATQASAASAAVAKAAGTSAAPVAGGALGLGVVKALVAHPILSAFAALSVTSGAGLGAYQAFQPEPTRSAVVADAAPRRVSAKTPAPPMHQAPPEQRLSSRASPNPSPNHPPGLPRHRTLRRRSVQQLSSCPPRILAENTSAARLTEQQALLDQARASLRRGDGPGALAIVQGHEARHPVTAFAEERDAIAILALVMAGRSDEARARAEGFSKRFPTSLFLPSIRSSLGRVEPSPQAPETLE